MPSTTHLRAAGFAAAMLILGPGCSDPGPARFAGRAQAVQFQQALRRCLARQGITYQPVLDPPGTTDPVVPAPPPDAWWASHGGYGLIEDQFGEAVLDPDWRDPNRDVADRAATSGWTASLYGPGRSPERFDEDSCFDRALRQAGFLAESRLGSLGAPTPEQVQAAAARPEVIHAQERRAQCLAEAGIDAALRQDPEAALRRRFLEQGIIVQDAVAAPDVDADELQAARDFEERVALADLGCRRSSGFDRTVDTALRHLMQEAG